MTPQIEIPKFTELKWVFGYFKYIWIPFVISIVFQFFLSFTSAYSIEALNIAASVVDNNQEINQESLLFKFFITSEQTSDKIILISCFLALIISITSTFLEIFIAWTISINQSILARKLTPNIITSLIENNKIDDIKTHEATIVQRWLLIKSISDFYHNILANSIGSVFNLFILLYFTYSQNIVAGNTALIIIIIWLTIMMTLNPKVLRKTRNYTIKEEVVGKIVRTSVSLSDSLKSLSIKSKFLKMSEPDISNYSLSIKDMGLWGSIMYGTLSGLSSLSPIVVVIITILFSSNSSITLTTAATLYLFISKISSPLSTMAGVIPVLQNQRIDFVRLKNAFDEIKTVEGAKKPYPIDKVKFIETETISINYNYRKLSYRNMLFEKGKITCLVGESGSGKTTFLKLLSGRTDNNLRVKLNSDYTLYSHEIIDEVGYLEQEPKLAELTVEENLSLFSTKKFKNPVLSQIYKSILLKLSQGENTMITSDVNGLSVGQRRLISIITILNSNFPILILDEPLNSLDENLKTALWSALEIEKKERIIILAMHEQKFINNCDQVVRI